MLGGLMFSLVHPVIYCFPCYVPYVNYNLEVKEGLMLPLCPMDAAIGAASYVIPS
jgi:hypothetical protein